MKKIILLLTTGIMLGTCLVLFGICKNHQRGMIRFGEVSISHSGTLSLLGQSRQYLIVPRDKYPADLTGLSIINVDKGIYVARFFEPGGVGVEGYFDVCFKVSGGKVFAQVIERGGSLERIGATTYIRSCSYVYDTDKDRLLKLESTGADTNVISFSNSPLKEFNPGANP